MKKILAMLLAVVMVLSLAACTSGNPDPTQTASEPPASQPGTEESTEPSQAPTEEPPAPAGDNPDDIADTMTSSDNKYQVALITGRDGGYVLKFKLIEWWEELMKGLGG